MEEGDSQNNLQSNNLRNFLEQLGGAQSIFIIWGIIDQKTSKKVLEFGRNIKQSGKLTKLNVIINSDGGNPNKAFMSASILQKCCDQMVVYVPRRAKSAATLMCLAANEIVLNLGAELGPLDTQVPDTKNKAHRISALQEFVTLRTITRITHTDFDLSLRQIMNQLPIDVNKLLPSAIKLTDILIRPLLEQVEASDIGYYRRFLQIPEDYGMRLLTRAGMDEKKAKYVAEALVGNYANHSFFIDTEEACEINLNAREADANEDKAMVELYDFLDRIIGQLVESCYYGPLMELPLG